jgi:prepilin-type N-terminal cleavage/methylation domain-containing protein
MLNNLNTPKNKIKGFTLVEMLVAIAVFMIVVTVAVGALYSIMDANKKAQSIKNVINNVSFAIESISKDMRVGKNYVCHSRENFSVIPDCSGGAPVVSYMSNRDLNNDGTDDEIWYRFTTENLGDGEGNIQRGYKKPTNSNITWESLTAPESTVKITNMVFYVSGRKATITIEGESGAKASIKTDFSLQTTVTQRDQD